VRRSGVGQLTTFFDDIETCVSDIVVLQLIMREAPDEDRVILGGNKSHSVETQLWRHEIRT
jgi:hypothetical protein